MDPAISSILVALIAAGLLTFVRDAIKWIHDRRRQRTPEGRESARVGLVDQNLLVVSKARDELAEDNRRLRVQLGEERAYRETERQRYEADRESWAGREERYRAEIESLESKVRGILDELMSLKGRLPQRTPPEGLPAVPPAAGRS